MPTDLTAALPAYGLWGLAGTIVLLALFGLLRGRVRIEEGWGGLTIPRFSAFQRLLHWVLALSFIVLALTALARLFGNRVPNALLPLDMLAALQLWSKALHDQAAIPFMIALVLAAVFWLRHSLPHWRDAIWLLSAGGLLARRQPAAWKFNAGQKMLYWSVVLCGLALSLTGLAMVYPGALPLGKVLAPLNDIGLRMPANLSAAEELRYAAAWHMASGLLLTCFVLVHVYLRTFGIQGAFSAMSSGEVDVNWARQHHSLWAARGIERLEQDAPEPEASAVRTAVAE